MCKQALKSR